METEELEYHNIITDLTTKLQRKTALHNEAQATIQTLQSQVAALRDRLVESQDKIKSLQEQLKLPIIAEGVANVT